MCGKILAVTFDGDGTLWDVLGAARIALESVAASINSDSPGDRGGIDVAELESARAAVEQEHPRWPMEQLRRQSFADVLARHGHPGTHIDHLWNTFVSDRRANTVTFSDAIPSLKSLHQSGIKTCLLSNGNTLPEHVGLGGLFDQEQVAEYTGVRKPDPAAFAVAAAALDCEPAAILHVGDSVREDYEAAQRAGFHAVLLDRRHEDSSSAESCIISTLARLPGIVCGNG